MIKKPFDKETEMSENNAGLIARQAGMLSNALPGAETCDTDAAIEQAVRSMLAEPPGCRTAWITAAVQDRVVTLEGIISDGLSFARLKNRITSAIPSVSIDDHVEWVVPDCGIGFV